MYLNKVVLLCLMLMLLGTVADAKIVFLYAPTPLGKERAIYVMDDNGRNKTRVFEGKSYLWDTQWTPTGQIFFSS